MTRRIDADRLPRGVRNRNPGNLRRSRDPWQGLAAEQTDREFFVFEAPEWGIRALARTLITYQDKHRLRTVAELIGRWAPPSENNTGAYIDHIASRLGVGLGEVIDVQRYEVMKPLTEAIIAHENAGYRYPAAVIDKGLALAGVLPGGKTLVVKKPQPRASRDGGVIATTAGSIGGGLAAAKVIADNVTDLNDSVAPLLGGYAPLIGACVMLAAFGVLGWRVYQRRRSEA